MKKKNFASKLQFQKTTVVSFNAMKNLKGGALINVNTQVLSGDGLLCVTELNCTTTDTDPTISISDTQCPRPTTRSGVTDFCGATDGETRKYCDITKLLC